MSLLKNSSVAHTDAESRAVQKEGTSRVTLASLTDKIVHEQLVYPEKAQHMTIVIATLENGFIIIGKSAPADPANFNIELGQKYAREDVIRQMWQLEGYLLRETLWQLSIDATPNVDRPETPKEA